MNCNHYFIIPPPNGATSIGKCKLCGLEREMFNHIERGSWRDSAAKNIETNGSRNRNSNN